MITTSTGSSASPAGTVIHDLQIETQPDPRHASGRPPRATRRRSRLRNRAAARARRTRRRARGSTPATARSTGVRGDRLADPAVAGREILDRAHLCGAQPPSVDVGEEQPLPRREHGFHRRIGRQAPFPNDAKPRTEPRPRRPRGAPSSGRRPRARRPLARPDRAGARRESTSRRTDALRVESSSWVAIRAAHSGASVDETYVLPYGSRSPAGKVLGGANRILLGGTKEAFPAPAAPAP